MDTGDEMVKEGFDAAAAMQCEACIGPTCFACKTLQLNTLIQTWQCRGGMQIDLSM